MENNSKRFYLKVNGQKVEVSEEVYRAYVQPIRREQRRQRREWRCQIKGPKGNLVRCQKDCRECPYALSGNNALGNKLSLDKMKDEGIDMEDRLQDIEQNYITDEEMRELYIAIATLTPRQQEIIRLIYFEEKTQEEVAAILSVSRNTVKTIYERTMVKLKKFFKKF